MEAIQEQQHDLPALQGKAQVLIATAKAHRITDQLTREGAATLRSEMKAAWKKIEAYRVWHTKPLNDQVAAINKTVRPMKEALDAGVTEIDKEIKRDHRERERIAEEKRLAAEKEAARIRDEAETKAQREADERAEEARKKAAQEAKDAGFTKAETQEYADSVQADEAAKPVEAAPVPVPVSPPPPQKTTVAESGASTTMKKVWNFEVIDVSLLPIEYVRVDLPAIRERMRADVKASGRPGQINGIRFFQDDSVSGR